MQTKIESQDVLTSEEAAQFIRYSPNVLRDPEWRRRVGLQAIRIGKSLRFLKRDLLLFMEERKELF